MDALYRSTLYKAKDNQRIQDLGAAVKTTLYGGKNPTPEQVDNFAQQYTASGGRIQNFNKEMIKWTTAANSSVANKVFTQLKTSPFTKNMMTIMGGVPLPDFRNQPSSTAGSSISGSGSGEEEAP
jgi:hypothetical protein